MFQPSGIPARQSTVDQPDVPDSRSLKRPGVGSWSQRPPVQSHIEGAFPEALVERHHAKRPAKIGPGAAAFPPRPRGPHCVLLLLRQDYFKIVTVILKVPSAVTPRTK